MAAAPEAVWEVLADAGAYGDWVVGTKDVARADANWPEPGAASSTSSASDRSASATAPSSSSRTRRGGSSSAPSSAVSEPR
jgi:hypothetical protein